MIATIFLSLWLTVCPPTECVVSPNPPSIPSNPIYLPMVMNDES